MSAEASQLPIARRLPEGFSIQAAFDRLESLPHRLWLDSASQPRFDQDADHVGRYSFLSADPVATCVASIGEENPWPTLTDWCKVLPALSLPGAPPFLGGIAGVIGYESGAWLEEVGVPSNNDLPTPTFSLGIYDWTIAFDHADESALLICNGIEDETGNATLEQANKRADQISRLIQDCTAPSIKRSEQKTDTDANQAANVTSNFTSQEFQDSVSEIVRRIRAGDSFQVNLAQRLLRKTSEPAAEIYRRLRRTNPAPFGGFFDGGEFSVLSSSPEGFLNVRDGLVQTRPIKGTIRRTGDADRDESLASELSASEKDRAENVMIVDLMRNDLSRVCTDESVVVRKLCEVEKYQYVQHLVSVVEGRLSPTKTIADLLQACFPGGSITGAPKIEAMRTIAELEPNPRGPYCGSMGYISCCGGSDWNILIRTMTHAGGYLQIPVGGGITARSEPAAEEAETWAKAEGMLRALN